MSGQLEAEIFACALSNVYTFGPTFRAENSNTSRHAAEFWMIEPEMAFCDLSGDMALAEDFVKHLIRDANSIAPLTWSSSASSWIRSWRSDSISSSSDLSNAAAIRRRSTYWKRAAANGSTP